MNITGRLFALTALVVVGANSSVFAHHSHGNYEIGTEIQVRGVVTEFHFANPHVWVFMDVENEAGEIEDWALEGGAPRASGKRAGMA